ncbi:DNA binding domain, excisionase family [Mycobacteroides abscessus subsp. abscessus]|nr:helix-turn-helix domain-containing protein [Mycobacteroides abscessus]SHT46703.1 DNA binding domain, excisionase family [Mycobacteroides abscessus subsp. abscessus]SHW32973.1 DNA binding domain, excisionase family [Mycobacteroides abscessus subsp. abscessus]SIF91659.1 DNA binding domain, excisionase family [Mycobacteroides abscessus subsp. abscessus]SKD17755.1 DNA binding domain, excisionase family [Mycobacteroides abscessus subsp. abscessus]SKM23111.1 DNA binding domain, excisionase family
MGGPEQVAELFGVHPWTARKWCREGRIPAFKVGPRLWRVDLDALMAQQAAK